MYNEAFGILNKTLLKKNISLTSFSPHIFIAKILLKEPSKISKPILVLVSDQLTQNILPNNWTTYYHRQP